MPAVSLSDAVTVTDSTSNGNTNNQTLTEPTVANRSVPDLDPRDQDGVWVKNDSKKNQKKRRRNRKRKAAEEPLSIEAGEEKKENPNAVVPLRSSARLQKKQTIESTFPILDAQTGPSQYRGRVDGGGQLHSHSSGPAISNQPGAPVTAGATSVVHPSSSVSKQTPLPEPAPAPLQPPSRVGGGGHLHSHSSGHAISNAPGAPVAAGATSVVHPSSSVSVQTQLPKPARVQPPVLPRKGCCEICKVECNTPEILEQHKNGKKHQKNMRLHEELQSRNSVNGQQSGQIPASQLNLTDQPKKVQESEKNGFPTASMGSRVIVDNHKEEIQLQNNVGNIFEVPAAVPEGKTMDNSAATGRRFKRMKRGGKGCKYMRTPTVYSYNVNRRKQLYRLIRHHLHAAMPGVGQQTVSFTCELCDAKFVSQENYQAHVNGRKHLSSLGMYSCEVCDIEFPPQDYQKHINERKHLYRLKNAREHRALFGVGPQVVSGGPLENALSNALNAHVQQGDDDNNPQVLLAQLLTTVLSKTKVPAKASRAMAAQIPAPTSMAGPSYEPQLLQTQVSEITAQVEMENPTGETKTELLPVPLGSNAQPGLKPVEPAQTVSFICELCDVKCESQVAYQGHVTGKKHLSKLRRAHDHQASSGVAQQQALSGRFLGVQALYPPDINALDHQASSGLGQQQALSGRFLGHQALYPPDINASSGVGQQQALSGQFLGHQALYPPDINALNHQASSGVGQQQALSGRFLGLQAPYPNDINALSHAINAQVQQGDNDSQVLLALMNALQALYPPDINALSHAINAQVQQGDNDPQVLLALLLMNALQALYRPDISALLLAINAQVQQGDNDPQVLLAQLLMYALQAQVPATPPVTGAMTAQMSALTSMAGPSYDPHLLQTQMSGIATHVEMENQSYWGNKNLAWFKC